MSIFGLQKFLADPKPHLAVDFETLGVNVTTGKPRLLGCAIANMKELVGFWEGYLRDEDASSAMYLCDWVRSEMWGIVTPIRNEFAYIRMGALEQPEDWATEPNTWEFWQRPELAGMLKDLNQSEVRPGINKNLLRNYRHVLQDPYVRIYSRGLFDVPLLKNAYAHWLPEVPWTVPYGAGVDMRTVSRMLGYVPEFERHAFNRLTRELRTAHADAWWFKKHNPIVDLLSDAAELYDLLVWIGREPLEAAPF